MTQTCRTARSSRCQPGSPEGAPAAARRPPAATHAPGALLVCSLHAQHCALGPTVSPAGPLPPRTSLLPAVPAPHHRRVQRRSAGVSHQRRLVSCRCLARGMPKGTALPPACIQLCRGRFVDSAPTGPHSAGPCRGPAVAGSSTGCATWAPRCLPRWMMRGRQRAACWALRASAQVAGSLTPPRCACCARCARQVAVLGMDMRSLRSKERIMPQARWPGIAGLCFACLGAVGLAPQRVMQGAAPPATAHSDCTAPAHN